MYETMFCPIGNCHVTSEWNQMSGSSTMSVRVDLAWVRQILFYFWFGNHKANFLELPLEAVLFGALLK